MQRHYNNLVLPSRTCDESRERATQELILCAHTELSSLVNATSFKKHHSESVDPDRNQILYESVDVIRYMMSIMNVWDISSDEFEKAFNDKDEYLNMKLHVERNKWEGQPVIIVDIDDVIAEFRNHFSLWLVHKYGVIADVESTEYYFITALASVDLNPEEVFSTFVREGGFRNIPVLSGAIRCLAVLRRMGYWIHLLTARPEENLRCLYDTFSWLSTHKIPFDDISFSTEKFRWCTQSKYYDSGAVKFVLDDSPKHALEYAKHGMHVKVPRKSYNKHMLDDNIDFYDGFENLISQIKE